MIRIDVKPRKDNKFDIYVFGANGTQLFNSSQGYENAEDAVEIVRKVFGPPQWGKAADQALALKVTFRDGTTHTEQLR